MKKLFFIYLTLVLIISGCDTGQSMEAVIINSSSQKVKVNFVSSEISELNKTLEIDPNQQGLYVAFQSGTSGVFLTFVDNDSIYIQDSSNEVLKIFKEGSQGKNIYNVDENWEVTEPSKNHFVYSFTITNEDLDN
ncbi:MAG: hypothetical protein AB3N10_09340 [Allomuricauda sp.]